MSLADDPVKLPPEPRYFPIERALYEVAPGLKPLGFDFGNGRHDAHIFQIGDNFHEYRKNKILCRNERLSKYYLQQNFSRERQKHLTQLIVENLLNDHPEFFRLQDRRLDCLHTGDVIEFNEQWALASFHSGSSEQTQITTPITDSLDALSMQVQEDITVTCRDEHRKDHLGLIHLCSPSHWAAEDKIGLSFYQIHSPIPGIEKINKIAENMVEAMINKGPFVRFIWSFVTDKRLNHHTVAPPSWNATEWKGRSFNLNQTEPFYFRVERQVVFGMPQVDCSLFTIRISFINGSEIKNSPLWRSQLLGALNSMTQESRQYKGVAGCFDELTTWLQS